jgi:hypothetical protein
VMKHRAVWWVWVAYYHFCPEHGGSRFLRNVGAYFIIYMASHSREQQR